MKSKTIRISESVVVGTAFLMGASLAASSQNVSHTPQVPDDVQLAESVLPVCEDSAVISRSQTTLTIHNPRQWTPSAARRFATLALKRAKHEAMTPKEEDEFVKLQQARREHYPETTDEFLAEWKQSKFRRELLEVLNRNVKFLRPEDQTRVRSIR